MYFRIKFVHSFLLILQGFRGWRRLLRAGAGSWRAGASVQRCGAFSVEMSAETEPDVKPGVRRGAEKLRC